MKKNWRLDGLYVSHVADLLRHAPVQQLQHITHHHHSTRLDHSLAVSYLSYRIVRFMGWDARAVARAGLLHDLFYYDWRTTKFKEGSHAYVHPRIACHNASKLTSLSALEKDIIVKHMWLATLALPRYKESYVVSFVDKYCAVCEFLLPKARRWQGCVKRLWQQGKATVWLEMEA